MYSGYRPSPATTSTRLGTLSAENTGKRILADVVSVRTGIIVYNGYKLYLVDQPISNQMFP